MREMKILVECECCGERWKMDAKPLGDHEYEIPSEQTYCPRCTNRDMRAVVYHAKLTGEVDILGERK